MFIKTVILLSISYFTLHIKGSLIENDYERPSYPGYRYFPEIQGWMKLHENPADWYTARINCHDEDAVLATPVNEEFKNVIWKIHANPELYFRETSLSNQTTTAIYVGIHSDYPEGIYKYNKQGKLVISLDPIVVHKFQCHFVNQSYEQSTDCSHQLPYICYAPAASACGEESSSYSPDSRYEMDERTGQCYKFHYYSETWNDAYRICQEEGSHLAIINSDLEAQVFVDLFEKYPKGKLNNTNAKYTNVLSLGFYYWQQADRYVTIFGQTLEQAGYAKWDKENPSSRGTHKELGGGMFRTGLLDDVTKKLTIPFICEKTPLPKIQIGWL